MSRIYQKLIKISPRKIFYLSIGFLSLLCLILTLSNLGVSLDFAGNDGGISLSFPENIIHYVYQTWGDYKAPGSSSVPDGTYFILAHILFILRKIGLSPIFIQRLFYFAYHFLTGVSMFALIIILSKAFLANASKKIIYGGGLIAALFYMFNHFTIQHFNIPTIPTFHITYVLAPLILGLFIYGLEIKNTPPVILAFALCFLIIVAGNPANTVLLCVILVLYLFIFLISQRSKINKLKAISFCLKSGLLIFFLASYLIIPMYYERDSIYRNFRPQETDAALNLTINYNSVNFNSRITYLHYLLRFAGAMVWKDSYFFQTYEQNPFFILEGYLITALIIAGLFFLWKKIGINRLTIFLASTFIIFIFFAKGIRSPHENIYLWFWWHIPHFLELFKACYYKFMPWAVLSAAMILGMSFINFINSYFPKQNEKKNQKDLKGTVISIQSNDLSLNSAHLNEILQKILNFFKFNPLFNPKQKLSQRITYLNPAIIFIILVIILLSYNWIFFTPFYLKNKIGTYLVKIPPEYYAAKKFFDQEPEDARTLILPATGGQHLDWGNNMTFVGGDADLMFRRPSVDSAWFIDQGIFPINNIWAGYSLENNVNQFLNFLNIFNVRYILLHNDAINHIDFGIGGGKKEYNGSERASIIRDNLAKIPEKVSLVFNNAHLALYCLADQSFLPHIYSPKDIIYVEGSMESLYFIDKMINDSLGQKNYYFSKSNPEKFDDLMLKKAETILIPIESDKKFADNIWKNLAEAQINGNEDKLKQYSTIRDEYEIDNRTITYLPSNYQINIPQNNIYTIYIRQRLANDLEGENLNIEIGDNLNFTIPKIKQEYNPNLETDEQKKEREQSEEKNYTSQGPIKLDQGQIKFTLKDNGEIIKKIKRGDIYLKATKQNESVIGSANIEFKKNNATRYIIHVENAKQPFFLNFSESFHPYWNLYLVDSSKKINNNNNQFLSSEILNSRQNNNLATYPFYTSYFLKPFNDENHFILNGYTNAWYINKIGTYDLILEYKTQKIFYLSLVLSGLSLIIILSYNIIYLLGRSKNLKNE